MKPFFLEFESNKAGQFYLAGFEANGSFEQRVLTNDLQGFAEAKKQPLQSSEEFVLEILERLRDEKFTLIAYSTAEMTIINNLFKDKSSTQGFAGLRYLNLLSAAKRWIRKHGKNDFEALPPLSDLSRSWLFA